MVDRTIGQRRAMTAGRDTIDLSGEFIHSPPLFRFVVFLIVLLLLIFVVFAFFVAGINHVVDRLARLSYVREFKLKRHGQFLALIAEMQAIHDPGVATRKAVNLASIAIGN